MHSGVGCVTEQPNTVAEPKDSFVPKDETIWTTGI